MPEPTGDFWTWALRAYARPGVAEACIDLQDRHGQNVPYLLWAAWTACEGRPLAPATLAAAADLATRWEAAAVAPLRTVRRELKPSMPGVSDEARETLRGEVKALELKAERILMTGLEALAPPSTGAGLPLNPALAVAVSAWANKASSQALDRLAQTLC